MVFTDQQLEEMKNEYISLLRSTNRSGIENVIKYLTENSDFFYAPSSSRFHNNFKGGLLNHSMNVYKISLRIYQDVLKMASPEKRKEIPQESLIISTLLHDVCKVNFYKETPKFYKDDNNNWRRYMSYECSDNPNGINLGHGEASVIMLQMLGLSMSLQEIQAIRWHMSMHEIGPMMSSYQKPSLMACLDKPLCVIVIMSDYFASFMMERTVDPKIEYPLPLN